MLHFFHLAQKIFQTFLEICVLCLFLFLSLLNLDSRATMLLFCSRRNSCLFSSTIRSFWIVLICSSIFRDTCCVSLSWIFWGSILGLSPLTQEVCVIPLSCLCQTPNCLTCIHVATFKSLMQTNKQKTDQRHWLTQSFVFFLHMVHQTSLPCFSFFLLCCLMKVTPPSCCFQKYWK